MRNHAAHNPGINGRTKKHERTRRRVSVDVDEGEGLRMEVIGEMHVHEGVTTQANVGTHEETDARA